MSVFLSLVCAFYIAFIILNTPHLLRALFLLSPNVRLAVAAKLQFPVDEPWEYVAFRPMDQGIALLVGATLAAAYWFNRDVPGAVLFLVDAGVYLLEFAAMTWCPRGLVRWWHFSIRAPEVAVGLSVVTRLCTLTATYLVYWRGVAV